MVVQGFRYKPDFDFAIRSVTKNTKLTAHDATSLFDKLRLHGTVFSLPDDFVLREDLERCNFIIN